MTLPFIGIFRGLCRVTNWPNFNIPLFQGIGSPKEREIGEWSISGAVRTPITFIKEIILLRRVCSSWHPKMISVVISNSLITDHYDKYNNNEKAWNIMRTTKCEKKTQSDKCFGKIVQRLALHRIATNPQFVKIKQYLGSTIKCNKARFVCIILY